MPRPLTAADRVPQVGDVLYFNNLRHTRLIVTQEGRIKDGVQMFKYQFESMINDNVHWNAINLELYFYISRADGGEVTIEES